MDKIDIETEIEQFYSVILILKPRSWNANGGIDIVTATVEYDFHYRTSNGFLKTSIAHPCTCPYCIVHIVIFQICYVPIFVVVKVVE